MRELPVSALTGDMTCRRRSSESRLRLRSRHVGEGVMATGCSLRAARCFAEEDAQGRGVGGHDGDFELDAGDDDDLAEGVGEVGHLLEFEEYGEAEDGD